MEIIDCKEQTLWNTSISKYPNSTYVHRYEWKNIIKNSYNLDTHLLIGEKDSDMENLLPFTICRSLKGKKKGVSMAFNSYGGILGHIDEQTIASYQSFIKNNFKVNDLEMRIKNPSQGTTNSSEYTFILDLDDSTDSQWNKFSAKVRNQIRKAEKHNIETKTTREVKNFYNIYSKNMGRLGTPVHSITFFKEMIIQFQGDCEILEAHLENKPIGAMILVKDKATLSDPFASTLIEYNNLNPNMLMYWHAIKKGIETKCTSFDMGRSQLDSGTYKFKKQWGARPIPTGYTNLFESNSTTSVNFYRSTQAKKLVSLWKKLPFSLQLFLGPKIRKYIP